jgi:hypothetical protein
VAAGTMSAVATRTPVFNGLSVVSIAADGLVTMRYDGYVAPKVADSFQTIVKVLPVFNPDLRTPLVANFLAFRTEGFVIRVTDGSSNPVPEARLRLIELMVEVSRYVPLR